MEGERKRVKSYSKVNSKYAPNFSWLMGGVSIDMCSIELQPKSSQKLNKTKALLCKNAKLPIVQNVSFK